MVSVKRNSGFWRRPRLWNNVLIRLNLNVDLSILEIKTLIFTHGNYFLFSFFFPSKVHGSFFHRSFGFKSENKNCCSWLTSLKLESLSFSLSLSHTHTHTYTHKDQNRDTVVQALARFVLFNFFTLLFFLSQSEREIRSKKIRCWKTTHCSLGKLTTPLLLVFLSSGLFMFIVLYTRSYTFTNKNTFKTHIWSRTFQTE